MPRAVPRLFGIEGEAASVYFRRWPAMLAETAAADEWPWPGRVGRGAADPINTALNVVYGALAAEAVRSIVSCGMDPHAGFLHSSGRNKPALALDLMEPFRPVVADSAVLTAINNGELRHSMFSRVLGDWRLTDVGRRALLGALERRLEQEFKHPMYRYTVTWRRAIEVQARMVLGVVDGSQPSFRSVRVR